MNEQSMESGGNGVNSKTREPPPFLRKLFNIVNDPNTNPLVSWGSFGTSIIIWDQIKFTTDLLPRYFKHSNFSSFVYQLNNYGFRKIGFNDCEYENPNFQAGREYLLANMTRRNRKPRNVAAQNYRRTPFCPNMRNNSLPLESKVEALRCAIMESGHEIDELKRLQADIELQIVEFQNIQAKYEKIIDCLCTPCDETVVVEANKKRRDCP